MGIGGDRAKLRELPMVSGVLPEVSSLVLGELLKWGPRRLERRHAHHLLPTEILTVPSQSHAVSCGLVAAQRL